MTTISQDQILTSVIYTLSGTPQTIEIPLIPRGGKVSYIFGARSGAIELEELDIPAGSAPFKSGPYNPRTDIPKLVTGTGSVEITVIRDDSSTYIHGETDITAGGGSGGSGGISAVPQTIYWTEDTPGNTGPTRFTSLLDAHAACVVARDLYGEAKLVIDRQSGSANYDQDLDFTNIVLESTKTYQRLNMNGSCRMNGLRKAKNINFRNRTSFVGPLVTVPTGAVLEFTACTFTAPTYSTQNAIFRFEGAFFQTVQLNRCSAITSPTQAVFEVVDGGNFLLVEAFNGNTTGPNMLAGAGGAFHYGFDPVSSRYQSTEQPLLAGFQSIELSTNNGFLQVSDTQYTTGSRLTVSDGVLTTLTNNAGSTISEYIPGWIGSVASVYDSNTNRIVPRKLGETFDLRITFKAAPTVADRRMTCNLDIGGTQGIIGTAEQTHGNGAGTEQIMTYDFTYYQLQTFLANGGQIKLLTNGNTEIWDIVYAIFPKG